MCPLTCDSVQLGKGEADGVGSVRAACGINSHFLSVQSRRLHFSFIAHVSVLMEEKDEPGDKENAGEKEDQTEECDLP